MKHGVKVRMDRLEKRKVSCLLCYPTTFVQTVAQSAYTLSFAEFRGYSHIIIIGIQPLGGFGQRPELIQSTGIALVRCILGTFLGVVCHCFPPRLDVPTFATRCLNDARDPSGGRWSCGRECCPVILPK